MDLPLSPSWRHYTSEGIHSSRPRACSSRQEEQSASTVQVMKGFLRCVCNSIIMVGLWIRGWNQQEQNFANMPLKVKPSHLKLLNVLVCICTSWYLRENRIIIPWARPLIRNLVQKKYYSCVTKSKQWGEKIKGKDHSGKMSRFQNAAGDCIKSTVIFKLVLNRFFLQSLFTKCKFLYALSNASLRIYSEGFSTILGLKSSGKVKGLDGLWKWKATQGTKMRTWHWEGRGQPSVPCLTHL